MDDKKLPKITCCVTTYNEEKSIEGCLKSIFNQNYPKDKLEVILVDDGSTDKTTEIAKRFPVKILINGKKDVDLSLLICFRHATGTFFTGIAADMQYRGKDWFRKMIRPLLEEPDLTASFTSYYSHSNESVVSRYLSLNPIQLDLVYQFFSAKFEDVIIEKRKDYSICNYSQNKIPPQVAGIYRVSTMKRIIKEQNMWHDLGNLVVLVRKGFTKFAYVPQAGYYHFHVSGLGNLLNKRRRNIKRSYLRYGQRKNLVTYKWFDLSKPKDIGKVIFLTICSNLIIPIFLFSLYRVLKFRNWLYILDGPITLILVDTIIFSFISDKRGRDLIINSLARLNIKHIIS